MGRQAAFAGEGPGGRRLEHTAPQQPWHCTRTAQTQHTCHSLQALGRQNQPCSAAMPRFSCTQWGEAWQAGLQTSASSWMGRAWHRPKLSSTCKREGCSTG